MRWFVRCPALRCENRKFWVRGWWRAARVVLTCWVSYRGALLLGGRPLSNGHVAASAAFRSRRYRQIYILEGLRGGGTCLLLAALQTRGMWHGSAS